MIERLSIEDWIAFDARTPAPTFFARPAWALALSDTYGNMRPAPLRIGARSGAILLPAMQMHGGPLRWREFSAFPLGAYTCFLREDGALADEAQCERAIAGLAKIADCASVVPWPMGPAPSGGIGAPHETGVIDLSPGIDAAIAGVEGIFRRMAGQALRRGVVCKRATDIGRAVDVYYDLLCASAKRWGLERPGIPKELISALVSHGGNDVEIWFAHAQDREIAGGIVLYGSQELFFWSAAMLAEYGRLRPSNALNFALMRAGAERGVRWYNLGSSEGLPGVARFKHEMGAQDVRYHDVRIARTRFKVYASVRRALGARATA